MRPLHRSTLIIGSLVGVLASGVWSYAQVGGGDAVIPYAGQLERDGEPVDGFVPMAFVLFNQPTGGTPLATLAMPDVAVRDGSFSLELGPVPEAAFTADAIYLEVYVDGTQLAGRQRVRAVPYAVRSAPWSDFLVDGQLQVEAGELRVQASHNVATADIGAFYAQNLTQGIGIGFDQVAAIGSNGSQSIRLVPKGGAAVVIEGPLEVSGSLSSSCRAGFTAVVDGRLCISALHGPARMHAGGGASNANDPNDGAIAYCRLQGPGSRVCTSTDVQQACAASFDMFAGVNAGNFWYGELVGNNLFMYTNGGEATCSKTDVSNGPSDAITGNAYFRCCY